MVISRWKENSDYTDLIVMKIHFTFLVEQPESWAASKRLVYLGSCPTMLCVHILHNADDIAYK